MSADDRALLEAINAITQMVPNIQGTIANIATLNEKVANIESNTKKQFDMLLAMQRDEQTMRKYEQALRGQRWRNFFVWLGLVATTIGNVIMAIYRK